MTNRPYEIDMPSLTKLKAMEDDAMGFSSATAPETPKAVRQSHAANEGNTPVAATNSAERPSGHQRFSEDPDDQRRNASPTNSQETAGVDAMPEEQDVNSHETMSQCEGHWLFADAGLGEVQPGEKSKAKGKAVRSPSGPETSTSPPTESSKSKAEVEDLRSCDSQQTQSDGTLHEQEYLIPRDDLLIMLEVGFAERPYWTTADLADALLQPEAYLNEVLPRIAVFGPWLGGYPQRWCWRLKPAEEKSEGRWKGKGRAAFWE